MVVVVVVVVLVVVFVLVLVVVLVVLFVLVVVRNAPHLLLVDSWGPDGGVRFAKRFYQA